MRQRSADAAGRIGLRRIGLEAKQAACLPDGNDQDRGPRRLEILKFWDKHGLAATRDAFRVSRRIVIAGKQLYLESDSKAHGLANQSRAPKQWRVRAWPSEIMARLGGDYDLCFPIADLYVQAIT